MKAIQQLDFQFFLHLKKFQSSKLNGIITGTLFVISRQSSTFQGLVYIWKANLGRLFLSLVAAILKLLQKETVQLI